MRIAVIDYRMGNLGSIINMLSRIGADAILTDDPAEIEAANKLILPGVGAFDRGMENLHKLGVIDLLNKRVLIDKVPVLGLCLGMQLFAKGSEEGRLAGLGWIDGYTVKFNFESGSEVSAGKPDVFRTLKVPHMGWNNLRLCKDSYIFNDLEPEARYYFVHSYYLACHDPADELARSLYGIEFTSAIARESIIGVQFHPEKSLRWGMQLLKRFVEYA